MSGPRTADELEEHLLAEGRRVLRQVAQDRLDQLAAAEQRRATAVVDAAGVAHTRVENGHVRRLATVFGPVTVNRMAYRAPGAMNLCPADGLLNLPVGLRSRRLCARKLPTITRVPPGARCFRKLVSASVNGRW